MIKKIVTLALILGCYCVQAQNIDYYKGVVFQCDFQPNCIAINADNTKLLVGGDNKMVVEYDLQTKKKVFEIEAHYQPVMQVMYSKVYPGFYTVGDKSVKLWLNGTDKPEKLYTGSHTSITNWGITTKEDFFVAGSYEKKWRYWDAKVFSSPQVFSTSQEKAVISVALSADNAYVAAGSFDHTFEIWKVDSMKPLRSIEGHADAVSCLQFINGHQQLLSASFDGYIKRWDVLTGKNLKVYSGHTKAISWLSVSADAKLLLSASYDNTISLFNMATGDRIYTYTSQPSPVMCVTWNAKGDGFFASHKDGAVVEWEVPKKVFVEFYYGKAFNADIQNNPLCGAKEKGESKEAYATRQQKAERFINDRIEVYYKQYLDLESIRK